MVTIAIFVGALILEGFSEPAVVWHFSLDACNACNAQQQDLMDQFFLPGDSLVIVYSVARTVDAENLKKLLLGKYSGIELVENPKSKGLGSFMVTGFALHDPYTNEFLVYNSTGGSYNQGRARIILNMFRSEQ